MSTALSVHLDPLGNQRGAESRRKKSVGLSTDAVLANGAAFAGIWPCDDQMRRSGHRCSVNIPVPVSATVASRFSISSPLPSGPLDAHRIARRRAGLNHEIDRSFVVFERGDRRGITVGEIVD